MLQACLPQSFEFRLLSPSKLLILGFAPQLAATGLSEDDSGVRRVAQHPNQKGFKYKI
jgi:hypothetical protein